MEETKTLITKESLIEFGMKENEGDAKVIFPFEKILSQEPDEEGNNLSLVITNMRNVAELALMLPDGGILYLGGIQSIEELEIFEKAITEYEPNF